MDVLPTTVPSLVFARETCTPYWFQSKPAGHVIPAHQTKQWHRMHQLNMLSIQGKREGPMPAKRYMLVKELYFGVHNILHKKRKALQRVIKSTLRLTLRAYPGQQLYQAWTSNVLYIECFWNWKEYRCYECKNIFGLLNVFYNQCSKLDVHQGNVYTAGMNYVSCT